VCGLGATCDSTTGRCACASGFTDCNADGNCVEAEYEKFTEQWRKAGLFYKFCQNPEDPNPEVSDAFDDVGVIKQTFETYNVDKSCRAYLFGCKRAARKHVLQCADSDRCVTCCQSAKVRWERAAVKELRAKGGGALCNGAIRCIKKATRAANVCRAQCRRQPTCGQEALRNCLNGTFNGKGVSRCYSKCATKCGSNESYTWCLQACQGLSECGPYEDCAEKLESTEPPGCLTKEPNDCVAVTTTSTSTSSSTTTTARTTTTSTSSSTTTTSPL